MILTPLTIANTGGTCDSQPQSASFLLVGFAAGDCAATNFPSSTIELSTAVASNRNSEPLLIRPSNRVQERKTNPFDTGTFEATRKALGKESFAVQNANWQAKTHWAHLAAKTCSAPPGLFDFARRVRDHSYNTGGRSESIGPRPKAGGLVPDEHHRSMIILIGDRRT